MPPGSGCLLRRVGLSRTAIDPIRRKLVGIAMSIGHCIGAGFRRVRDAQLGVRLTRSRRIGMIRGTGRRLLARGGSIRIRAGLAILREIRLTRIGFDSLSITIDGDFNPGIGHASSSNASPARPTRIGPKAAS